MNKHKICRVIEKYKIEMKEKILKWIKYTFRNYSVMGKQGFTHSYIHSTRYLNI